MEFDLTHRLLPHLDRHLCLPLLDFLEQTGQYTHQDLLQAKLEILQSTNMVNYIAQLDKELDNGNGNSQVQQGKERYQPGSRSQRSGARLQGPGSKDSVEPERDGGSSSGRHGHHHHSRGLPKPEAGQAAKPPIFEGSPQCAAIP
jgi:hypothetical protein